MFEKGEPFGEEYLEVSVRYALLSEWLWLLWLFLLLLLLLLLQLLLQLLLLFGLLVDLGWLASAGAGAAVPLSVRHHCVVSQISGANVRSLADRSTNVKKPLPPPQLLR